MAPTIEATPNKKKIACTADECKNTFQNKKNMEKHLDKFHKIVSVLSNSPLATTVRTLFHGESVEDITLPSTQGTSDGRVNSPRVRSEGSFQCAECDKNFSIKHELNRHMTKKHNKAKAANINDKAEATKTDMVIEDEQEVEEEIVEIAEDLEMEGAAMEVENRVELDNMVMIDNIVDSFVENAFNTMNPGNKTDKIECHECVLKEEIMTEYGRLIDEKELKIVEKTATVTTLGQRVKKLSADNLEMKKRVKETDQLKTIIDMMNIEIANLKMQVTSKTPTATIVTDALLKKCKKCPFKAANMSVLGLHMNNDHQYEFECAECGEKFPFKNQLKLHRREVHEEGTFACFVCNYKFKTHKQLKTHIQKKCKSNNTASEGYQQRAGHLAVPQGAPPTMASLVTAAPMSAPPMTASLVTAATMSAPPPTAPPPTASLVTAPTTSAPTTGDPPVAPIQVTDPQVAGVSVAGTSHQTEIEWLPRLICPKCDYEMNTQTEFLHHIETEHQLPTLKCDNCPQVFKNSEDLVGHMVHMHTSINAGARSHTRSLIEAQINAHIWRCSFCGKQIEGKEARHSHMCNEQERNRMRKSQEDCTRGPNCRFLKAGKCWYKHAQIVGRSNQSSNITRNTGRRNMWCAFQDRCTRRETCAFKHMDEERDFLQQVLRRAQL